MDLTISANRLGDLKAEDDSAMLNQAFLETPDYRTLLESNDKVVVVGRRGTGKSALVYKLEKDWAKSKSFIFKLAPDEAQVIGLRPILEKLNSDYTLIRAALKIAWEGVLYHEIFSKLSRHYKFGKYESVLAAMKEVKKHHINDRNVAFNLRKILKSGLDDFSSPEEGIAELADFISIGSLQRHLKVFLDESKIEIKILIDRLDEGYKPDTIGISYIAGIIQGTLTFNSIFDAVRPLVFIRDNMFRAVSSKDPDYTRNIEGSALRLHWSENQLLNLSTKRLRVAFNIDQENDIRAWNHVTSNGISGRNGFRTCLRLTLFRPRDLLALLNQAFYTASRDNREKLIHNDIEATAKEISQIRLDDLAKEYQVIFPSITEVISLFKGFKAEFQAIDIKAKLYDLITSTDTDKSIQQEMAFFDSEYELIKALYSVGFLGLKDKNTEAYSFCHDGRDPNVSIIDTTILFVHPCYQIALNLSDGENSEGFATEIHDDYVIEISSISQEQRNRKIGQLISEIRKISHGKPEANEFEEWCLEAVKTIFAGDLSNCQLHPNKDAAQRRDIVATNTSESGVWKRIVDDYDSRQVIFEIKNYTELKPDDFRQLSSYLVDTYGKIGFIICRSENKEPSRDRDLVWIRDIYWKQEPKKLLIILSHKHLIGFLEKIRNPQKHDAVDKQLQKILDTYHRQYLNESIGRKKNGKKKA